MGVTVLIPNGMIEPLVSSLDNWIRWLRPGTLSAKIGAIKGAIMPMAQGVYYDREALIDEHSAWDTAGEGEGQVRSRKVHQIKNLQGAVIREEVIMRDSQKFNLAMRDFVKQEQPVELPYLMKDEWIQQQSAQLVKDQMGLTPPDYGPMRYILEGMAKSDTSDKAA